MDISQLLVAKANDNFKKKIASIIMYISAEQQGPRNGEDILESVKARLEGIIDGMNIVQENNSNIEAAHSAALCDIPVNGREERV